MGYQVTNLQARTFAIWTFMTAIVRLYGAYYIHQKPHVLFIAGFFGNAFNFD